MCTKELYLMKKNRKFLNCFIRGITGSGGSYWEEKIHQKSLKTKIYGSYRSVGY